MLRTKLSRHTLAFVLIVISSIALYAAAKAQNDPAIWTLLAIISAAAILTVQKEP